MSWEIHQAKMEDWCREYTGPKFHAVLCDPPYGLSFMNKKWDQMAAHDWAEALKLVLLPGALVFAFGGTRMWHRLACGFEDAGFEIWETLMWIHGQGFPKAQDLSKLIDDKNGDERTIVTGIKPGHEEFANRSTDGEVKALLETGGGGFARPWMNDPEKVAAYHMQTAPASEQSAPWAGFKTAALKPAWEPILCFKAPTDDTYAHNALEHGSGALNVDRGRVVGAAGSGVWGSSNATCKPSFNDSPGNDDFRSTQNEAGRYPANVVLDSEAAAILDEQTGVLTSGEPAGIKAGGQLNVYGKYAGGIPLTGYGDTGGASRFFYCAKAGRFERDAGLDDFEKKMLRWSQGEQNPGSFQSEGTDKEARNFHPTVKPTALNKWLAGMLLPPQVVSPRRLLIPFSGSGSEMIGAVKAGWDEVVGIEQEKEYCEIARARVKWWLEHPDFEELQGSLF